MWCRVQVFWQRIFETNGGASDAICFAAVNLFTRSIGIMPSFERTTNKNSTSTCANHDRQRCLKGTIFPLLCRFFLYIYIYRICFARHTFDATRRQYGQKHCWDSAVLSIRKAWLVPTINIYIYIRTIAVTGSSVVVRMLYRYVFFSSKYVFNGKLMWLVYGSARQMFAHLCASMYIYATNRTIEIEWLMWQTIYSDQKI